MKESFVSKLDAFFFRFLAMVVGFGAAAGIIANNGRSDLLGSPFAIFFVLVFLVIGLSSLYSIVKDFL